MNTSNNSFQNKLWIAALILCVGVSVSQFQVSAAPQNNEKNDTPFPLELQPPLVDNLQDAVDSYGNPITFSQPIQTPDGRKVVTAQGVQFEIPNYASGITEIKKPIESLLPPFVDPNAAEQQKDAFNSPGIDYSTEQKEYTLPDWLADFNDPDVGPGVPYTPSNDENSLKVLSWDLVPPKENDPHTENTNLGIVQQNRFPTTFPTKQAFTINQGVQMAINQPRTTTPTTSKPTTTTIMTTTTSTTTTTPSPVTKTTDAQPLSTASEISSEIFELPGGNSEVLPSWLEGFDDPELSIAVPFEIPEDNNEYNHTLSNDLLPPLEPFEDLKVLSVPGFAPNQVQPDITTTEAVPNTTPYPIRTTSIKSTFSTFKPFQFKFLPKQPTSPPISFTQKPLFTTTKTTTIPTTTPNTITESPIPARIPPFTLKSSAQPTGFKINSFMLTQSTVKPTLQTLFDVKSNPFLNLKNGQFGFTSFQNPPTTTTTTTASPATSEFILGSVTTPSWLTGISHVNPGPGVPFSLPEKKEPEQTFNGIISPTSQVAEQTIDGSILPNNQTFISTSTPLPEPSRLFTPPMVVLPDIDDYTNPDDGNLQSQTIPINSYNIPEATESNTKPTSKVTFNKSNQGKVISNSVFEPVQPSTKPFFGVSQPANSIGFESSTLGPAFQSQPSTAGTVFAGKYTGGFKGAPGILGGQNRPGYAIQPDGSIRDPDHAVLQPGQVAAPTINLQSRFDTSSLPDVPTPTAGFGQKRDYKGSFGGPPGVLIPYDNVSPV
ncbi:mucin-2 isoform X2 [Eupeodes corollae]|uniref:mucin-2 isoform X2 n=1 Tax=Eupeodes corollae TaxID=290404 RepID=UPI0024900B30|nr:mucin-2 isoform X2 [Eupeodes corollae]